ncbi:Acetyl-coenzyme A carboxylase carboxyl transferase subunit alpha [bacterium HR17]|jgi:acetyl-CoA carboxylase carboxyl transferase subunit alpha|uniref:Acetyl-coenzyme A carboxylase carboxyl transferase subunit alpha n=1 Tax=Candidatus Fervidibacter japonicus TaxID=2035412 RepID=A0A2H5XBH7_9BACT|nr:Acetyl-coenzyme A carboxylase carboxyl transferase subunit alpha [bacterium HR17]
MHQTFLPFEQEIAELEERITHLRSQGEEERARDLEAELQRRLREIAEHLSPYERVMLARHPLRPYALDYINAVFDDFVELHGDRLYGDDPAIVGGLAWLDGQPVVVVGQQKGRDAQERIRRNFGMPHPEGYRKALRLMQLAEQWRKPLITFVDTPGASCLDDDERRNICGAIAHCQMFMAGMTVPNIAAIIGEGGSGGAIALAVANKVLMQENATYSVIQPESCAAIIWRDEKLGPKAAEALQLTARDALRLGVIDEIVPEPPGGAQRDYAQAARLLKEAIVRALAELKQLTPEALREQRYRKFRAMGKWLETDPTPLSAESDA